MRHTTLLAIVRGALLSDETFPKVLSYTRGDGRSNCRRTQCRCGQGSGVREGCVVSERGQRALRNYPWVQWLNIACRCCCDCQASSSHCASSSKARFTSSSSISRGCCMPLVLASFAFVSWDLAFKRSILCAVDRDAIAPRPRGCSPKVGHATPL